MKTTSILADMDIDVRGYKISLKTRKIVYNLNIN